MVKSFFHAVSKRPTAFDLTEENNRHTRPTTSTTIRSHSNPDFRFDWVAVSYRPDPITLEVKEVVIGKGFSTKRDTINILLDALPIADTDNFCRVILRPADFMDIDEKWPDKWTVLSYKTDRNGSTKKTIIGTGWLEDNEILVCLDALPTPNQNIECWMALKPRIERHYVKPIEND